MDWGEGLERYHVTYFNGMSAVQERRIWLNETLAKDAIKGDENAQAEIMAAVVNVLRGQVPGSFVWRHLRIVAIPLPRFQ